MDESIITQALRKAMTYCINCHDCEECKIKEIINCTYPEQCKKQDKVEPEDHTAAPFAWFDY